jgi:peptide/nickel transport system permease protein
VTLPAWFALLVAFALATWVVRDVRRRTARHEAGRRFFRHPTAAWGIGVLAFFVVVAVAAPLVTSYDPRAQLDIVHLKNQAPSWSNILGTDVYSRDLWSRVAFGARVSLIVGALGMLVAVTVGTLVGAVAGYYRHWVDAVLMRGVDVGLALPRIFVLLIAIALFGQLPLTALVLAIGLTSWFGTSRLVRAEVLSVRERDFVAAARAVGAGPGRVIFRHVLPNAAAPIIVSAALGIGNVLLLEAALSFLGIGVASPTPSWGNMIADGAPYLASAPWTTLFPGLAIALVVMALNAVGDALRDALDPRQEEREERGRTT